MPLQFKAIQTWQGQELINSFIISGSDATADNADRIAEYLANVYLGALASSLHNAWSLHSIVYRDSEAAAGTPFLPAVIGNLPVLGTNTGLPTTNQTALLLATSGTSNAPWRGRVFLGGFAATAITPDGLVSTGASLAVFNFGLALRIMGAELGLDVNWAIRSQGTPKDGPPWTVEPGTTNVIDISTARTVPSTQRKRKIGVGS